VSQPDPKPVYAPVAQPREHPAAASPKGRRALASSSGLVHAARGARDEGVKPLLENEHATLLEDPERRVVTLRRHPTRAGAESIVDFLARSAAATRPEHRTWGIVIDFREAVGVSDPELESRTLPMTQKLVERFERSVVLVRTQTGALQIRRLGGPDARVTTDEERAFAYAAGESDAL